VTATATRLSGKATAQAWDRLHPRLTHRAAWLDHDGPLQTLGWTKPRLRSSEAADRWTWLVIAAYAQLRLARPLATDLRRPWEKPTEPNKLTPARVRSGFRDLCTRARSPAAAPKPSCPALAGHRVRKAAAPPPVTTWAESSPPARRSADPPTPRWAPNRADLVKRGPTNAFL
jgi:hypothetical protein